MTKCQLNQESAALKESEKGRHTDFQLPFENGVLAGKGLHSSYHAKLQWETKFWVSTDTRALLGDLEIQLLSQ